MMVEEENTRIFKAGLRLTWPDPSASTLSKAVLSLSIWSCVNPDVDNMELVVVVVVSVVVVVMVFV